MEIGGLQRFTLSDYPGMPSAVIFCQGCNFRCPFCHNKTLLPLGQANESHCKTEVFALLRKRVDMLDGVVFSGGEPTLQDDLAYYLKEVKFLGYKTKLDTNGSRPAVIDRLLTLQLVDYIAMDIKAPWCKYPSLTGVKVDIEDIRNSVDCIHKSSVPHHFRTTWVEQLLTPSDITAIRREIPNGSRHILQPFISATAMAPSLHPSGGRGDS